MTAYGSREQGLRSMPINPKVERRRNRTFGLMAEQYSRPSERPDPMVVGYSEGRLRLRRQLGWTSGRPESPMKAVQTRCPQKALAVLRCFHRWLKPSKPFATCKRPALRSLLLGIIVSEPSIRRETGCVHGPACRMKGN